MRISKINLRKIITHIKPFLWLVVLFAVAMTLLKITETIYFVNNLGGNHVWLIIKSVCFNLGISFVYALFLAPVCLLLSLIQKQFAFVLTAILFAFIVLFEIGFIGYSLFTGTMMGSEIITRPLSETLTTIQSSAGVLTTLTIVILVNLYMIGLGFFLKKKKISFSTAVIIVVTSLSTAVLTIVFPAFFQDRDALANPTQRNYLANKSWYCIHTIFTNQNYTDAQRITFFAYDEQKIADFLKEYPDRKVADVRFPLERINNTDGTLAAFFKKGTDAPNIVLIIGESLSRTWSGGKKECGSYTPFLDSLAKTGLYWKNCLTTTHRSFGAVPALTGSVPYGSRGFQFGKMPAHNTLLSILKENNYHTNAFYAGEFAFDGLSEYLSRQNTEYMSPFFADYKNDKQENLGFLWGYHDHILFKKTLEVLNSERNNSPMFNLIVTLTTHNSLDSDNPIFHDAIKKADKINASLSKSKRQYLERHRLYAAGIVYLDDAIRNFINEYQKRPDFKNTIFIITGDHDPGLALKNELSKYHVPLIIWSPLIETPRQFPAIVTHNDVVPSIVSLLRENFNLQTPTHVSWIGHELDTSSTFRSNQKHLFFGYDRYVNQLLYDNYLLYNGENVYKINQHLDMLPLKPAVEDTLKPFLSNKLDLLKYINNYVYEEHLTQYPLLSQLVYTQKIFQKRLDSLVYNTQMYHKDGDLTFFEKKIAPPDGTDGWKKLKITLSAQFKYQGGQELGDFPILTFHCSGVNKQPPSDLGDRIAVLMDIERPAPNIYHSINISKEFFVTNVSDITTKISFFFWNSNTDQTIELKDIVVTIEGIADVRNN